MCVCLFFFSPPACVFVPLFNSRFRRTFYFGRQFLVWAAHIAAMSVRLSQHWGGHASRVCQSRLPRLLQLGETALTAVHAVSVRNSPGTSPQKHQQRKNKKKQYYTDTHSNTNRKKESIFFLLSLPPSFCLLPSRSRRPRLQNLGIYSFIFVSFLCLLLFRFVFFLLNTKKGK